MIIVNWAGLSSWQQTALEQHCRLASECAQPHFRHQLAPVYSLVLTVNSGYE